MKRRDFVLLLAGAMTATRALRAQQQKAMPVIGWLSIGSREFDDPVRLTGFRQGLGDTGYVYASVSNRTSFSATYEILGSAVNRMRTASMGHQPPAMPPRRSPLRITPEGLIRDRRTSPSSLKPQPRPRSRTKKWRLDGASLSSA